MSETCRGHLWEKIIGKLFASSWYIFLSSIQAAYNPSTKSHVPFLLLRLYHRKSPRLRQLYLFPNKASFYGEGLLEPHPTPKLEDHPLSPVCDCLFNIFTATLHIGGRTPIRNLRMCHTMVTGNTLLLETTHLVKCMVQSIMYKTQQRFKQILDLQYAMVQINVSCTHEVSMASSCEYSTEINHFYWPTNALNCTKLKL